MKRESATTTETTWRCGKITSNVQKDKRVQTQQNVLVRHYVERETTQFKLNTLDFNCI